MYVCKCVVVVEIIERIGEVRLKFRVWLRVRLKFRVWLRVRLKYKVRLRVRLKFRVWLRVRLKFRVGLKVRLKIRSGFCRVAFEHGDGDQPGRLARSARAVGRATGVLR
jgi:hypothetical protein